MTNRIFGVCAADGGEAESDEELPDLQETTAIVVASNKAVLRSLDRIFIIPLSLI